MLTEEPLAEFASRHGFRLLGEDGIATNAGVHFLVEHFEPSAGFEPAKPYKSRLMWRYQSGRIQSKLLLAEPDAVIAVAVRGEAEATASVTSKAKRRSRKRATPAPA